MSRVNDFILRDGAVHRITAINWMTGEEITAFVCDRPSCVEKGKCDCLKKNQEAVVTPTICSGCRNPWKGVCDGQAWSELDRQDHKGPRTIRVSRCCGRQLQAGQPHDCRLVRPITPALDAKDAPHG